MNQQQCSTPVLVTLPELKTRFGIPYSRMTLWRREKDGTFPKRVNLSASRVAWRTAEVEAWVSNLKTGIATGVLVERMAADQVTGGSV